MLVEAKAVGQSGRSIRAFARQQLEWLQMPPSVADGNNGRPIAGKLTTGWARCCCSSSPDEERVELCLSSISSIWLEQFVEIASSLRRLHRDEQRNTEWAPVYRSHSACS